MKAKKTLLLLLALIVIFAAVSATLANDTVETRTRNRITTGSVEIAIDETSAAGDGRIAGTITGQGVEFDNVMPGQTASKVVTIRNDAEACWLRVRVDISVDPTPQDGSDPKELIVPNFSGDNWVKDGEYYYYNRHMEKGDVTAPALFDSVLFAPGMGNDYAGAVIRLTVTAEAIRYRNNEAEDAIRAWGMTGDGA